MTNKRVAFYRWGASLRIQPPLIHSRYYVGNAKRQVVAGVNEKRPYLQASREPERGKNPTLLLLPCYHARIPIVTFLLSLYPPPPPHTHTHTGELWSLPVFRVCGEGGPEQSIKIPWENISTKHFFFISTEYHRLS